MDRDLPRPPHHEVPRILVGLWQDISRKGSRLIRRTIGPSATALVLSVTVALLGGCPLTTAPEDVAREYVRSLYANDSEGLWRLISTDDRRVKNEATFRRQQRDFHGFARDALRQLADYMTATPVKVSIAGDRATVTLRFQLLDANAPEILGLLHDWDEDRLSKLTPADRRRIATRLEELLRKGRLPIIEGDQTIELVREAGGWKVFRNWAGGVLVTFSATVDSGLPLDVTVSPSSIALAPGERVRVSIRARNIGGREVMTRVKHRIEPQADANHLALLQCPVLLPTRLGPGAAQEYESEYLLLADVPTGVKAFKVNYRFPAAEASQP